jgi:hypothetical protein
MLIDTIQDISIKFKETISDIEVIVRLDLDDLDSFEIMIKKFDVDVKYIIDNRFDGYASLPYYIQQCYNISEGYFFVFYNDDAEIINHHNIIDNLKKHKDTISISTEPQNYLGNIPTSQFPIIHHKIIEITGGFNPEVIYVDGHYDNVQLSLPKENQFHFSFDVLHPKTPHGYMNEIYKRRDEDMVNSRHKLGNFDGNFFVNKDSNLIKEYFSNI